VNTNRHGPDSHVILVEVRRPEEAAEIRRVLGDAKITYDSGFLASGRPAVVFTVPRESVRAARDAIAPLFADSRDVPTENEDPAADDDEAAFEAEVREPGPRKFPTDEVIAVAAVIFLNLAVLFWTGGPPSPGRDAIEWGGLTRAAIAGEPWRFLTSLFLHSGIRHVLANGFSMLVFAVPLLTAVGRVRTAAIYLASGIGGGIVAVTFASPQTIIIGSSGAVAGLFGAWVVMTLRSARAAALPRRARIRTLGIALLVLPSLLTPMTASGTPVSVSSHLGGLATGMLVGALVFRGVGRRTRTQVAS
jgi:membrane associated rhomboid family serine protease